MLAPRLPVPRLPQAPAPAFPSPACFRAALRSLQAPQWPQSLMLLPTVHVGILVPPKPGILPACAVRVARWLNPFLLLLPRSTWPRHLLPDLSPLKGASLARLCKAHSLCQGHALGPSDPPVSVGIAPFCSLAPFPICFYPSPAQWRSDTANETKAVTPSSFP